MFISPRRATHLALAAILCLSLTSVQAAEPSNICDFNAFTTDPDPAGTNVRSGPGTQFPVLAVLPQSYESDGDSYAPGFHVIGFSNGWLQIENAAIGQYGDEEHVIFEGPGWVSSKLVDFYVGDGADPGLRDAPSSDAVMLLDLLTPGWTDGIVTLEAVHACQGYFVDVTIKNAAGKTASGWTSNLCGNQVTTCP